MLDQMIDRYSIPIRTIVGGLRPGPGAEPLDEITRRTLTEHWNHVEAASGQPFDHTALARDDWIYDTELGAIAVVTMRHLSEPDTLRFFTRLQRAFYAENVDITDPGEYRDLLDEFEVDPDEFLALLSSEEMKRAAWEGFEMARRLSVTGFPTLLLAVDEEYLVVTRGYLPGEALEPALTGWIRDRYGDEAEALIRADTATPR